MAINPNKEEGTPKTAEEIAIEQAELDRLEKLKGETEEQKIARLVQEGVDKQVKQLKDNLDKAYEIRDAAEKKLKEKEAAEREAEIKRLEAEGKHREVYEARLKDAEIQRQELDTRNKELERRNTELTRDANVRAALQGLDFKNDRAAEMAFKEIAEGLTRNDKGEWVHKSGVSIKDFIAAYVADDNQSFLFKTKASSGGGSGSGQGKGGSGDSGGPKSLFDRPQEEVIRMAAEGKL